MNRFTSSCSKKKISAIYDVKDDLLSVGVQSVLACRAYGDQHVQVLEHLRVCTCVYVCAHVSLYVKPQLAPVCAHVFTHTFMCACIYVRLHACIQVSMNL